MRIGTNHDLERASDDELARLLLFHGHKPPAVKPRKRLSHAEAPNDIDAVEARASALRDRITALEAVGDEDAQILLTAYRPKLVAAQTDAERLQAEYKERKKDIKERLVAHLLATDSGSFHEIDDIASKLGEMPGQTRRALAELEYERKVQARDDTYALDAPTRMSLEAVAKAAEPITVADVAKAIEEADMKLDTKELAAALSEAMKNVQIVVNVPKADAPIVHVAAAEAPIVHVESAPATEAKPRGALDVDFKFDSGGKIIGFKSKEK